jgi:hypothetical protein
MVHPPGRGVFEVSTSVLRRAQKKAGNLLHARYGFYEPVVRLVVRLETAIFHRASITSRD